MKPDERMFDKQYFQELENSIGRLPQVIWEELHRPCAERCMKDSALGELQRQFAECDEDLDLQYKKYGRSEYFFADINEAGHIYELGYPKCTCPMVASGMASSPVHCECSRQSFLFVLGTLMPDKAIQVETLRTVLAGAEECRFRVVID